MIEAKARAGKRIDAEHALMKLARFYVDMNHIVGPPDIFREGGRVPATALEFIEHVCETIGYHKGRQTDATPDGGDAA